MRKRRGKSALAVDDSCRTAYRLPAPLPAAGAPPLPLLLPAANAAAAAAHLWDASACLLHLLQMSQITKLTTTPPRPCAWMWAACPSASQSPWWVLRLPCSCCTKYHCHSALALLLCLCAAAWLLLAQQMPAMLAMLACLLSDALPSLPPSGGRPLRG